MATYYLETGSTNPFYNLAFEEYVLRNRIDGDFLLLWQNNNTIVVGQNQVTEAEINRKFVEAYGIHVVRRSTGGGAVYHDLGNLNYSFITDAGEVDKLSMERFTSPIVQALQQLGLNAEASGRNDILVDGQKVSGTAQRLMGGRILHHGTLLFDSDPEMVSGALNADPEKFRSKGTQSVRSRIGNIRSFLKTDMELPTFWAHLKTSLTANGMLADALMSEEIAVVKDLERTKYATWEWTFGHSPKYDFTNRHHFTGGTLEVGIQIENGSIKEIGFYGDFLSRTALTPVQTALQGIPFRKKDVKKALSLLPLKLYFGEITMEDVLSVLFNEATQ